MVGEQEGQIAVEGFAVDLDPLRFHEAVVGEVRGGEVGDAGDGHDPVLLDEKAGGDVEDAHDGFAGFRGVAVVAGAVEMVDAALADFEALVVSRSEIVRIARPGGGDQRNRREGREGAEVMDRGLEGLRRQGIILRRAADDLEGEGLEPLEL